MTLFCAPDNYSSVKSWKRYFGRGNGLEKSKLVITDCPKGFFLLIGIRCMMSVHTITISPGYSTTTFL